MNTDPKHEEKPTEDTQEIPSNDLDNVVGGVRIKSDPDEGGDYTANVK